jgi:adenylate cyclase
MTEGTKRRLAAIASLDVVGYSRLMGEDETGTLTNLQSHRSEFIDPLIAQHSGRIVKTMGDGLLLEFSSAVNATQCAIDIQKGVAQRNESVEESRRIIFRVAVNTGDVIVEGEDIFGDGVNVAARLQEIAQPGAVCLSGVVFDQVSRTSDQKFDDLGYRKLKNISQPVRVYQASLATAQPGEEALAAWPYLTGKKERKPVASGGCLCGRTRFEIWGEPEGVGYCHCRFCQLAIGAPLNAWVVYEERYVSFVGAPPQIYKSSQIAERAFCGTCGTSLYTYLKADDTELFYYAMRLATMDNPEDFPPSFHYGVESKLPWLDVNDSLPRIRTEDDPGISARWAAVGQPKSGQKLGTAVERLNSIPKKQK